MPATSIPRRGGSMLESAAVVALLLDVRGGMMARAAIAEGYRAMGSLRRGGSDRGQ